MYTIGRTRRPTSNRAHHRWWPRCSPPRPGDCVGDGDGRRSFHPGGVDAVVVEAVVVVVAAGGDGGDVDGGGVEGGDGRPSFLQDFDVGDGDGVCRLTPSSTWRLPHRFRA